MCVGRVMKGEIQGGGGLHLFTHYTFHVHSDAPIWSAHHLTKSPRREKERGEARRDAADDLYNLQFVPRRCRRA